MSILIVYSRKSRCFSWFKPSHHLLHEIYIVSLLLIANWKIFNPCCSSSDQIVQVGTQTKTFCKVLAAIQPSDAVMLFCDHEDSMKLVRHIYLLHLFCCWWYSLQKISRENAGVRQEHDFKIDQIMIDQGSSCFSFAMIFNILNISFKMFWRFLQETKLVVSGRVYFTSWSSY